MLVERGRRPGQPGRRPWCGCRNVFTDLVEQRLAVLGGELGRIEDEVLADRDHIGREVLGPLRRELSRYAREFAALRGAIHRATAGAGRGAVAAR